MKTGLPDRVYRRFPGKTREIFEDPNLFLYNLDLKRGRAYFIRVPKEAHKEIIFHFAQGQYLSPYEGVVYSVDISSLAGCARPVERPVHYIFHTTLCNSTLLARCLGYLDKGIVLREPAALRILAGAAHADLPRWQRLLRLVTALYAKADGQGSTVIKADVASNFIMGKLLRASADSAALFLYQDLKDFLVSSIRGQGIERVARSSRQICKAPWQLFFRALGSSEVPSHLLRERLAGVQTLALMWLSSIYAYIHQVCSGPDMHRRLASLNSKDFIERPEKTLLRISAHFGMDVLPAQARSVARSGLFQTHVKSRAGAPFLKEEREKYEAHLYRQARHVIDRTIAWARDVILRIAPRSYPNPLAYPLPNDLFVCRPSNGAAIRSPRGWRRPRAGSDVYGHER